MHYVVIVPAGAVLFFSVLQLIGLLAFSRIRNQYKNSYEKRFVPGSEEGNKFLKYATISGAAFGFLYMGFGIMMYPDEMTFGLIMMAIIIPGCAWLFRVLAKFFFFRWKNCTPDNV